MNRYTIEQKKAMCDVLRRMVSYSTDHHVDCPASPYTLHACSALGCQTNGADLVATIMENIDGLENDMVDDK